ncbi:unnamed protein product [Calypogeia fissa]
MLQACRLTSMTISKLKAFSVAARVRPLLCLGPVGSVQLVLAAIAYVRLFDHTHRRWRETKARARRTAKLPPVRAPSIFLPLPLASTVPPSLASLRTYGGPAPSTYDGGGFAVSSAAVPVLVFYHSSAAAGVDGLWSRSRQRSRRRLRWWWWRVLNFVLDDMALWQHQHWFSGEKTRQ